MTRAGTSSQTLLALPRTSTDRRAGEEEAERHKARMRAMSSTWTNNPTLVYFARRERDGLIKIGFSSVVNSRISALSGERKGPVVLVAVAYGGRAEEAAMHRKFADDAVGEEWFRPSRNLLGHIDTLLRTVGNPRFYADAQDPKMRPITLLRAMYIYDPALAREHILAVIKDTNGNVSDTARRLSISRRSMFYYMRRDQLLADGIEEYRKERRRLGLGFVK